MRDLVLVTGGNGQVATALKKLNSDLCYEFCSSDDLDICDSQAVGAFLEEIKPRLVINTAAYTAVDGAEEDPGSAYRVNKLGSEVLAIACATAKAALIHLSTDYVFSGESNIPYTEEADAFPLSIYGKSKLDGENAVRKVLGEHVILRLSAIFSGYAKCFPMSILREALQCSELHVISDQNTGPTCANSIAVVLDVMARKILAGKLSWGTYHFAQQPFISWYEFAQMILQIAKNTDRRFVKTKIKPVNSEDYKSLASRPNMACLDSSKLAGELCLDDSILCRATHLDDVIRQITQQL